MKSTVYGEVLNIISNFMKGFPQVMLLNKRQKGKQFCKECNLKRMIFK